MVLSAYAVVDPNAVMVITINTMIALIAMSTVLGGQNFTYWTNVTKINILNQFLYLL